MGINMKGEAWRWLFLLSGICGTLLLLGAAEGLLWNHWGTYLAEAGLLISAWIFFEIFMKWHWPVFVCVTGMLLLSALAGIKCRMGALFFMAIFQFSFCMLQNLKKTSGSLRIHTLGRMSLIVPAALFLAAAILAQWNTDGLYQAVYQAEGIVRRNIKRASGTADQFSDGVVNRGNIYPADIEQFRVRVSREPSEDMYLKDFTGGFYTDGTWEPADDKIVFERMNQNTLHWEQWEGWIANLYESLYFAMNRSAVRRPRAESREMFIEYNKNLAEHWYAPYYSRWDKNFWNPENYAEFKLEYFERGEVEIQWGDVNRYFETARDWYHEVQDAYLKEAEAVYTEVPKEEVPGISNLCDEHPMESRDEALEFIRKYLREQASYTRTPGMVPLHKDPVEFFLFEKKEGYCQHFASAAVLMFRLYGIPARYAAGYRISRSDFAYQEDGTWHAAVTDASAHAWPEIFVEDYGWIPVEVTAAPGNDAGQGGEAGGNQDHLPGWPEAGFLSSDDDSEEPVDDPADDLDGQAALEDGLGLQSESQPTGRAIRLSGETVRGLLRCMAALVVFAALWMIVWHYRVKWLWMREGGSRRIYRQLLRMVHSAGYLKEYDGSENGFPAKLAEIFPVISYEEAERLTGVVNEETFGRPEWVNPEKISFAEEIYRRIAKNAFPKSAFYKRMWF